MAFVFKFVGEKTIYLRVTKKCFFPHTPPWICLWTVPKSEWRVQTLSSSFSPPLLLLSDYPPTHPPTPHSHTWERFHPYLVFSHWSDPNNEPTRHSSGGGSHAGAELYKVAERERGRGRERGGGGSLPCRLRLSCLWWVCKYHYIYNNLGVIDWLLPRPLKERI